MPRNLEARNFLSLLQRSPSPPPPPPLPAPQRAVCALSLLAVSIASSLLHFAPPPFATPFLPSSFCHTPSCHVIPLIPFRRPYHRDPWTSTCPPPFSLFCSRVPSAPSLPVETHALTHQPIRPCDARLYRGCTTWPLANYLSSCSCASKRREGLPPREGFFFDHPGANIDKVNVAV